MSDNEGDAGAAAGAAAPGFTCVHFNTQYPAAAGEIATLIHSTTTAEAQMEQANNLYDFMWQGEDMRELNDDNRSFTAILHIPETSSIRLVSALGYGTAGIGRTSPIANRVLALYGEGGATLGTQQVLVLPKEHITKVIVRAVKEEEIAKALQEGQGLATHILDANKIKENGQEGEFVEVMRLAPVPAYLFYDAFEEDVPVLMAYERLMFLESTDPAITHAVKFLRTCLVGKWRQSDERSYPVTLENGTVWNPNAMIPGVARTWGINRSRRLYPSLFITNQHTPPAAPATARGQGGTTVTIDPETIRNIFEAGSPQKDTKGKEDKDKCPMDDISPREIKLIRTLCGLHAEAPWEEFPKWYKDTHAKNLTKKDKQDIVRDCLEQVSLFEEVEVMVYGELVKMIIDRKFEGDDMKGATLANAAKGISPFAMIDISEEDIAIMDQEDEDRNRATVTTSADNKAARSRIKAKVPTSLDGVIARLKELTSMVYAIFGPLSPGYIALYKVVTTTVKLKKRVGDKLSDENRACIMWIVLLQMRAFSKGQMAVWGPDDTASTSGEEKKVDETTVWLPEFVDMLNKLQSHQGTQILHDGCPDPLYTKKRKEIPSATGPAGVGGRTAVGSDIKRQKHLAREQPHPTLGETMRTAMKAAPGKNLTEICKFCDVDITQLLPGFKQDECRNYIVLGTCRYGDNCKFNHKTASTAQATAVTSKLKKFLDNPAALKINSINTRIKPLQKANKVPLVRFPQHKQGIPKHTKAPLPPMPATKPVQKPAQPLSQAEQHYKEIFGTSHPFALTPEEQYKAIKQAFYMQDTIPEHDELLEAIGKSAPKVMDPQERAMWHDAAQLLQHYADNGCPVDCGEDWTQEEIEALLQRGPHVSAKSKEAIAALLAETKGKVKNGYARLVRYGDIKHKIPKKLKISPVAMVPHKSRKFRTILDLSFRLRYKGRLLQSVNSASEQLAPAEAMIQLGNCIKRLVALMADNEDPSTPFMFSKLDIKDGFWRMSVSEEDAWNFCYALPSSDPNQDLDDVIIVVPNCLQMGWCESPPFFCAASETARDIIDHLLQEAELESHAFEDKMMEDSSHLPMHRLQAAAAYVNLTEVFVDDFIGVTNDTSRNHLTHFSRAMLHGIHSIFPPPSITGHQGEDPISQKKLHEGEGTWSYQKEILGWLVDGANFTIQLMPSKCEKILLQIKSALKLQYVPILTFQELAGKLQHASFGIPGGKGLFSPIYLALKKASNKNTVRMTLSLQQILRDWRSMIQFFKDNATPVSLLVSDFPNYVNFTDACGLGAGGVITPGLDATKFWVWQEEWPEDIKARLITADNPNGDLTINDLELAGMVLGWLGLEMVISDLCCKHVAMFCDNTSAVAWAFKGSTSTSIAAGRLLRLLSLRQRTRQASSLIPLHLAGKTNEMADAASRAFKNERILDRTKDPYKLGVTSDILLAWRSITDGITNQTAKTRLRYWQSWKQYCAQFYGSEDHYLERTGSAEKAILLTAFAARVRTGAFGRGNQVKVSSVSDALAAITTSAKLVGKQSPVFETEGEYILPVKRCLEGFRRQDPPSQPQLAVPSSVPKEAFKYGQKIGSDKQIAIGCLCSIAFYFLLRVGEYTDPRTVSRRNGETVRATRTKQFRVGDIGFFKDKKPLPRNSPLKVLRSADSATMRIDNQKNGIRGQTLHHQTTGDAGAVDALAIRVHHILSNGGNEENLICDVYTDKKWSSITSSDMVTAVKSSITRLGLDKNNAIPPHLVGSHSLRAGGAMALYLADVSIEKIRMFGRWTSDTWMMYIHSQIDKLHDGVADKMCMEREFLNIAFIEPPRAQ